MRSTRPMLSVLAALIFLALLMIGALALASIAIRPLAAQGILIPRCGPNQDCVPPIRMCRDECSRPRPMSDAQIVRGASRVRVTLTDRVLHYEVDETFVNHGGRVGEADYIFPLPKNAAFADLKLSINGELVSGETMDAGRARGIYEEIVRRQRDPALVEWMGYGMLRTRIFPIAPGEEKRIIVRFDQVVEREGDALRVDYVRGAAPGRDLVRPVVHVRGGEEDAGRSTFVLTYPSTSGYGDPYSPTHELDVSGRDGNRRVSVLGDAREVTILIPVRRASDAAAISLLANNAGREDGFALITLTPPAALRATAPRDVTFVLDVSGSMSGKKMEQARAAGHQFLSTLSPRDRFRLIDFSTDVRSFRDGFEFATRENVRAAQRYLDALTAEGSTNISGALQEALHDSDSEARSEEAGRLPLVLFITDGEPTVGERRPDAIATMAARLRGRARLFTFGLGTDVNVALLEQLALEGHGTANFVRPSEDVERVVSVVASRLTNPVATDVRVHAEGVRLSKLLPGGAIDIFTGQDLVVLARYSGSGRATLRFDGNTTGGPVHWSQQVDFPERERSNAFVPRLWATQRVGYLSAERRKSGGNRELDDEIRSLGERFGIPTEFTSYLVLEPGTITNNLDGRMQPQDRSGAMGASSPAPAMRAREEQLEAAKKATAQRAVTSLSAADVLARSDRKDATGRSATQRVGDRVFILTNDVWTDARLSANVQIPTVIRVQPFSDAYFAVINLVPELKPMLAIGERVKVAGRAVVVQVAPDGAKTLSDRDTQTLRTSW
ncbi:MAG: VIT domain-containing protein [Gemmatimonadaceae bacterium]